MFCGGNCDCGGSCGSEEDKPVRISTDKIQLRQLGNVVYRGVNKDSVNKFEILHFELYFLCSECGHTQKFDKDDAPYYAIRFMANYPCISCGDVGGFSSFMIVVSPDQGLKINEDGFLNEEQFLSALTTLESMRKHNCGEIGRA